MSSNKYLKMLNDLKQLKEQMKKDVQDNPEEILKNIGVDISKINSDNLKKEAEKLKIVENQLSKIFPTEKFANTINLYSKLNEKGYLTEDESKKLLNVFAPEYIHQVKENAQECFSININECDGGIIDAHSIQKRNNKLSRISQKEQVYFFTNNHINTQKTIELIPIAKASTFRGFCKKHDEKIFQPIEKNNAFNESVEHCFLHSYRSFAYSYHRLKEFQNILSFTNPLAHNISELIDTLSDIISAIGMNTSVPVPSAEKIKITEEQFKELEEQRFENHRIFLNNYYQTSHYDQLDYIVYKLNHVCPIVSASWLILHIEMGNNFIMPSRNKTYRGFPCTVTIFPEKNNTSYIILSRFKFDSGSELIFNRLNNLRKTDNSQFEIELTKQIFEQVENFYVSPYFWDLISEAEKNQITSDINSLKQSFPEVSTFVPSINIFDKKYAIDYLNT